MDDGAYILGTYDFRRIGIRAAAARYNAAPAGAPNPAPAAAATMAANDGAHSGAPWFTAYSTRKAKVMAVNTRMDQLWRDIETGHYGPAPVPGEHGVDEVKRLRDEFGVFMRQWQTFVGGLSIGGMLLPSTEDYANSVDKKIEHFSKRLTDLGGRRTHQPYIAPPIPTLFPWSKLFMAVAVVGVVAGIIFVGSKLPDVPGRRYAS